MEHSNVSRETFISVLREDLDALGITLEENVITRYADLYEILLTWNQTHNLTRITDPALVATRHFAESLALFTIPGLFTGISRCADVGSGAGFPGLPLAIARPDISWTLIEKTTKKAAFLSYVAATFDLPHVTVIAADAVNVTERFNLVVSRAVASDPRWVQTLKSLCTDGGKAVLYTSAKSLLSLEDPKREYHLFLRNRQVKFTVFFFHSSPTG